MPSLTHALIERAVLPQRADAPSPSRPDAELRAEMRVFLHGRPAGLGVWVFAYGSLMWQPEKASPDIVGAARLHGHARRYALRDVYDRGVPGRPGLTLGLEPAPGLACPGLLLHLPGPEVQARLFPIWKQEMGPGFYKPAWLDAALTPSGAPVRALTFLARHDSLRYAGTLPVSHIADTLARAAGPNGTAAAYLLDAAETLRRHGLRDPMLEMLEAEVARRLLTPVPAPRPADTGTARSRAAVRVGPAH